MQSVKKHLLLELSAADWITVTSTILIVNAFWLVFNHHLYYAIAVTFISMFLDYLDGRVARKFGGSPYGKVIDSLYDILGWVLFPALVVNIETHWAWWSIVITTVYCAFALMRLSRFTVAGYVETNKRYYTGMPVSYSRFALLIAPVFAGIPSAIMLGLMIPTMVSSRLFRKSPQFLMQINLLFSAIYFYLAIHHV